MHPSKFRKPVKSRIAVSENFRNNLPMPIFFFCFLLLLTIFSLWYFDTTRGEGQFGQGVWKSAPTTPDPTFPIDESLEEQFPAPRRCHDCVQRGKCKDNYWYPFFHWERLDPTSTLVVQFSLLSSRRVHIWRFWWCPNSWRLLATGLGASSVETALLQTACAILLQQFCSISGKRKS